MKRKRATSAPPAPVCPRRPAKLARSHARWSDSVQTLFEDSSRKNARKDRAASPHPWNDTGPQPFGISPRSLPTSPSSPLVFSLDLLIPVPEMLLA